MIVIWSCFVKSARIRFSDKDQKWDLDGDQKRIENSTFAAYNGY